MEPILLNVYTYKAVFHKLKSYQFKLAKWQNVSYTLKSADIIQADVSNEYTINVYIST